MSWPPPSQTSSGRTYAYFSLRIGALLICFARGKRGKSDRPAGGWRYVNGERILKISGIATMITVRSAPIAGTWTWTFYCQNGVRGESGISVFPSSKAAWDGAHAAASLALGVMSSRTSGPSAIYRIDPQPSSAMSAGRPAMRA